jgi:hypothetical protein
VEQTASIPDDGSLHRDLSQALVRRLSDGRFVIGDRASASIRVLRRDGSISETLARRGRGPGELPGAFLLSVSSDTIFVFGQPPFSPSFVFLYRSGEGYLSSPRTGSEQPALPVVDRLASGGLVVRRGPLGTALRSAPPLHQLVAERASYGIVRSGHDTVAWLPPVIDRWSFSHPWPHGPISSTLSTYPFAVGSIVVASGDRVWAIQSDSGIVRAYDGAGREVVNRRLGIPERRFDPKAVVRAGQLALGRAERAMDSARALGMMDPQILPKTMPFVSAAIGGYAGELWLRLFESEPSPVALYLVLDKSGRAIAEISIPGNLMLQQVGQEHVVGLVEREDGTREIVEYRLRR